MIDSSKSSSEFGSEFDTETRNLGSFAERVAFLRLKSGLIQEDLAQKVGVSKNTIQKYELGHLPRGAHVINLAQALGCSLDWLFLGEGPIRRGAVADTACPGSVQDQTELLDLRRENRELWRENKRLSNELLTAIKENADLRVELAEIKARAAPAEETPAEDTRKSA